MWWARHEASMGDMRNAKCFYRKNLKETENTEGICLNDNIILKWMLRT